MLSGLTGADATLLERFVSTFNRLDDSADSHDSPPPAAFADGLDPEDWNVIRWRPVRWESSPDALGSVRRVGQLPALFETLALAYRWPRVRLRIAELLPNPPGDDLQQLASAMFSDSVMNATLLPARYVRFAVAVDCYDVICFDLNRYNGNDCPIVRLEHESILMHDRIGYSETIHHSFRDLVIAVVNQL